MWVTRRIGLLLSALAIQKYDVEPTYLCKTWHFVCLALEMIRHHAHGLNCFRPTLCSWRWLQAYLMPSPFHYPQIDETKVSWHFPNLRAPLQHTPATCWPQILRVGGDVADICADGTVTRIQDMSEETSGFECWLVACRYVCSSESRLSPVKFARPAGYSIMW